MLRQRLVLVRSGVSRIPSRKWSVWLVVVVIGLLAPSGASAVVHTGGAQFEEPTNPPSIGAPPPPLVDTQEFDHTITATYDDQAGTLTVTVEVFDPAHWGARHTRDEFALGPKCEEGEAELQGRLFTETSGGTESAVDGSVTLKGYAGAVAGTGSFNGQFFSVAFHDAQFVGREWRCLTMSYGNGPQSFNLGEWPVLSPQADAAAFLGRIGHGVPPVENGYVCPAVEIFEGHSGCFAEYNAGGRWHLVSGTVTTSGDSYAVATYFSRSWVRRWVRASRACLRTYRLAGQLESNYGGCAAGQLAGDVATELRLSHRVPRRVGWHGTDTAGFDPMALFRCRRSSGAAICANAVGDAFRYRP
jgi:hypothetical protein